MKILLLAIADYASVEQFSKKLNIIGVFDRITSKKFPFNYPRFAVVVKVAAEIEDHHDERKLTIEIIDEDGDRLVHLEAPFRFLQSGPGLPGEHAAVVELNNFPFPKPGIYNVEVRVDDEFLGRIPLQLLQ